MKRTIILSLILSLSAVCGQLSAAEATAAPEAATPTVSTAAEVDASWTAQEIGLKVVGQNVRVTGANGLTLEVYSITGSKVASYAIDASDKSITLNLRRGWYILKVGSVTRKVSINA